MCWELLPLWSSFLSAGRGEGPMLFYMLAHMVLHQLYEVLPKCMSCASQLSQCRCLSMQPATSGFVDVYHMHQLPCSIAHAQLCEWTVIIHSIWPRHFKLTVLLIFPKTQPSHTTETYAHQLYIAQLQQGCPFMMCSTICAFMH